MQVASADQDITAARGTYERFLALFKYGAIVAAAAGFFVIWLIS